MAVNKRSGDAVSLSTGLDVVLKDLKQGEYSSLATSTKLKVLWPQVCGPSAAAHTAGTYFKDGVLTIFVDTPAWAQDLGYLSEKYRDVLNVALGEGVVTSLSFVTSRYVEQVKSEAHAGKTVDEYYLKDDTPRIPLTTEEHRRLEEAVASVSDEKLRTSLLNAIVADFEGKKGRATIYEAQEPRQG